MANELTNAQSMEAVARLAGGVAHIFNNITQSIGLACEMALRCETSAAVESKLHSISQDAKRASEVANQLLAVSQRQILHPRAVCINHCVRELLPELSRIAGLRVRVELELDASAEPVFLDPNQFAIVLKYLAGRAGSAMREGGQLRISTGRCPYSAGPCTVVTVADTGAGMDEIDRQHIFHPFFSTRGTLLGSELKLSAVHGIIAQSKGRIECESGEENGTVFRIYLPNAEPEAERVKESSDPPLYFPLKI